MPPSSFPTLETPRLLLREIVHADAPALFAVHGDPESMKWFGVDPLPDEAAALKLVDLFAGWRTMAALCRSVWNLTAHPMLCQAR